MCQKIEGIFRFVFREMVQWRDLILLFLMGLDIPLPAINPATPEMGVEKSAEEMTMEEKLQYLEEQKQQLAQELVELDNQNRDLQGIINIEQDKLHFQPELLEEFQENQVLQKVFSAMVETDLLDLLMDPSADGSSMKFVVKDGGLVFTSGDVSKEIVSAAELVDLGVKDVDGLVSRLLEKVQNPMSLLKLPDVNNPAQRLADMKKAVEGNETKRSGIEGQMYDLDLEEAEILDASINASFKKFKTEFFPELLKQGLLQFTDYSDDEDLRSFKELYTGAALGMVLNKVDPQYLGFVTEDLALWVDDAYRKLSQSDEGFAKLPKRITEIAKEYLDLSDYLLKEEYRQGA